MGWLLRATPEELSAMLWVDKHAPRDSKKIIGQGGAQSNANKLKVRTARRGKAMD